ncbi:DUF1281 family ferredoxin-like fold protein [Exercitatus varius]|uniref:DUF1281 family ferredoxin-like fold protein n=1 Tax=Exercitatus varius TaxID=67857 RepID=UPI00294B7D7A|nr:hypothetical protein [Exercitatus varius]MDG2961692.1 hypothetical protein [Exercitatus varius]
MPNWIINKVEIVSSVKTREVIMGKIFHYDTGYHLDFNLAVLMPVGLQNMPSDNAWAIKHWGTKSNGSLRSIEYTCDGIAFYFETAWNPPIAWFKQLAQTVPEADFYLWYHDPNSPSVAGLCTYVNGQFSEDTSTEAVALALEELADEN